MRLYTVNKRRTAYYSRGNMYCLRYMFKAHAFLKAALRIGVYAVRTLYGVCDRKPYQNFLSFIQHTRLQGSGVPGHEFPEKLLVIFTHFSKSVEILILIILGHNASSRDIILCFE